MLIRYLIASKEFIKIKNLSAWPKPDTSVWSKTLAEEEPIPNGLDWLGWLGDRPFRPYSPLYSPTRWRNWWGFGNGAICDIGTHM
ncbi:hypothetical protein MLD52_23285, partial [Puniceicoccaceae bacterium K14]|nr:hypothetical protein [Puniceicoccaceae bacterium K14]